MKKFLIVVLSLAALYYAHHMLDAYFIRRDSRSFVNEAVDAIAGSWDSAVFLKYADPQHMKSVTNLPAIFAHYRTLGKPKAPADCDMKDFQSYTYKESAVTYNAVTYQCAMEFANASAILSLVIYRFGENAPWKFQFFEVSPAFNAGGTKP